MLLLLLLLMLPLLLMLLPLLLLMLLPLLLLPLLLLPLLLVCASALRRLGFDYIFDTDFSADLTIMEEGHELLHRLKQAWGLEKAEGGGGTALLSCSTTSHSSPWGCQFIITSQPCDGPMLYTCWLVRQLAEYVTNIMSLTLCNRSTSAAADVHQLLPCLGQPGGD
jgi:hypothetical protein